MYTYDNAAPDQAQMIALSSLERYTGSSSSAFQSYILLVNFPEHLDRISKLLNADITYGSVMSACHSESEHITAIQYGIGSPMAALVIDLLSFIKPKIILSLGYCGGLRGNIQKIGEYFNPVAAIREEGTSMAYMPKRCPSLSSFIIQRFVCQELEAKNINYHNGVIHTTNVRFWEFNTYFKQKLIEERSQAIDMECATLFTVGYSHYIPVGALLLISDLPLQQEGIKTKESARKVVAEYADTQVKIGINVLKAIQSKETSLLHYSF